MNRNSNSRFSSNPINLNISRSMFNRNHSVKFSMNIGDIVPFLCDEVLPGDTVTLDTSKVVRLQTLVAPIMDDVFLDTYYFFVPHRLIWEHWIDFMGENRQSAWVSPIEYSVPMVSIPEGGYDVGTIADYMGVPVKQGAGVKISALPFRSYALICDQWFRSENLMNPINIPMDDTDIVGSNGDNQVTDIVKGGKPFVACKTFDLFTSCLPQPQKGKDINIGFDTIAPVEAFSHYENPAFTVGNSIDLDRYSSMRFRTLVDNKVANFSSTSLSSTIGVGINKNSNNMITDNQTGLSGSSNTWMLPYNLGVDLSNSMFSINQLRQAFAVQRYYEKLARGGSRYTEMIKSFFGVTSPDARLQRSEYLGGNRIYLNVNQVIQTSSTDANSPQGNTAAFSCTNDYHSDCTKSFTEHGYLIGLAVARYDHSYQNGLSKMWKRQHLFDFYNPTFANVGEMPIYSRELYLDNEDDVSVFGYNEAWSEYRYSPNRIAGELRSNYQTPLDMWHLADKYNSRVYLSDSWIREDKTNLDRCLAVSSNVSAQIIADFWIKADWARPMPLYSIPGLIDHN
ncbi:major capsid protein [Capybara microvirus Cap3_SP_546]|nr:major capsid protein [Capybara microvirus Cap3_SP_546]